MSDQDLVSTWIVEPQRALLVTLAILAAGIGAIRAASPGSSDSPPDSNTFVLSMGFYAKEDGQLKPGSGSKGFGSNAVTSLYYGKSLTNAIITGALLPEDASEQGSPDQRRSPARPLAEPFLVDHWTVNEGLPGNKVRAVLPTRDGYLWVGTADGLVRFDGVRFEHFAELEHPEVQKNGGSGQTFHEDADGRLWIGTMRGLLCFHNGRFESFPGQEALRGVVVNDIAPRAVGGIWLATHNGVAHYHKNTLHWVRSTLTEPAGHALSVHDMGDGRLWVGGMMALIELDLNRDASLNELRHEAFSETYGGNPAIVDLFQDRKGRLWVGSYYGIFILSDGKLERVPVRSNSAMSSIIPTEARFFEDPQGSIWASTEQIGGVFRIDTTPSIKDYRSVYFEFDSGNIYGVHLDSEGALWLAARKGLFRLRSAPISTLAFDGFGQSTLKPLAESADGRLWFAGDHFLANWRDRTIRLFSLYSQINSVGDWHPSVAQTQTGHLWISHPAGGLLSIPESSPFPPVSLEEARIFNGIPQVTSMVNRDDGTFWIGTRKGLYFASTASKIERVDRIPAHDICDLKVGSGGAVWIGTRSNGLHRIAGDLVQSWSVRNSRLRTNQITDLHLDSQGTLWVGTGAGLVRISESLELDAFDSGSGLPQTPIHGILDDDQGRLWISQNRGICSVALAELNAWIKTRTSPPTVSHYGLDDGLTSLEVIGPVKSCLKTSDGRLWFGKLGGLAVIEPSRIPVKPAFPQVWIERMTADDQLIADYGPLTLASGQGKRLEFKFTATSLHSPEEVVLQYRLVGHDPDWQTAENNRKATYHNLPPEDYEFRVRARNHRGVWSSTDAALMFQLPPFFWQTWSFYTACVLALGTGMGALLAWRLHKQRRELDAEKRTLLQSERARIARDMHDHLGPRLAEAALLIKKGDSNCQPQDSLKKLKDLIWSVHPNHDTLRSLVDFIADFSHRYLAAAGISLDLDLPIDIPDTPIDSRFRAEIAAMFKEALTNVVRHAGANKAWIRLHMENLNLSLSVRDNGVGFDPTAFPGEGSRPGRGYGLQNFRVRSLSVGRVHKIQSASGEGTLVEWAFPMATKSRESGTRPTLFGRN